MCEGNLFKGIFFLMLTQFCFIFILFFAWRSIMVSEDYPISILLCTASRIFLVNGTETGLGRQKKYGESYRKSRGCVISFFQSTFLQLFRSHRKSISYFVSF